MDTIDEKPVKLIHRCFNELRDEYTKLLRNLLSLEAQENEIVKKMKETANNCPQSEKTTAFVSIFNSVLEGVVEVNSRLQQNLPKLKDLLIDKIHYLPLGPQVHSFKYIGGDSPWNFWLQDTTVDIKLMHKTLMERFESNEFKRLCSLPSINTYVCYVERSKVFRGKVLQVLENDRIKLMDVDTCSIKRVHQDSLYEMNMTASKIHALAINCSLSEDFQEERMWSTDLREMFINVLTNGTIYLEIYKKLNDAPVFLVSVRVTDDDGNNINVKEWICERIIPELQKILDKGLEPLTDHLSPSALDPYFQQHVDEELDNKKQLCEENHINVNSVVRQYNPQNVHNSLVNEDQSVNLYKIDSDQQKLKIPNMLEVHENLEVNISDSKVMCNEETFQGMMSKDIKDSSSCTKTTQVLKEGTFPEEASTFSEFESYQKCVTKEVLQENKNNNDLLDVCKNIKETESDTKENYGKTEVENNKYVQHDMVITSTPISQNACRSASKQHDMVIKSPPISQNQYRNAPSSSSTYQPLVYSNPPIPPMFYIPPFVNSQPYPFQPVHNISSLPFLPNLVPPFTYNRPHTITFSGPAVPSNSKEVKISHYPEWSNNTYQNNSSEQNSFASTSNSVNSRESSSSPVMSSEYQNKTNTVHNSSEVSSVRLSTTSKVSNVEESGSRQNYTNIPYDQNAERYKTWSIQNYENTSMIANKGLKNYHVDLKKPRTLLNEGGELKILMSYVGSPWDFYVHFSIENNIYIDKLKEDMTNYYSDYVIQSFPSYSWFTLKEMFGKYCACHWNNFWYRVEVLDWNNAGRAHVFFVDYGNKEFVPLSALRPLFEQFAEYNMMAQHCHLADILPIDSEGNCWSEYAKEFFCSLIDIETQYTVIVVSSRNNHVSNSLGVILFSDDDGSSSVNEILVTQGIAVAQNKTWKSQVNEHSYENTEVRDDSHIDSREQKHNDEDIPSAEAEGPYRVYSLFEEETEDASMAIAGYKAQDERRICKFYARDGYCWKRVCTKEHSLLNEGGVTSDKMFVYNEALSLPRLPDVGQILVVKVTAVFCLSRFYIQMPEKLSGHFSSEDECEMETLSSLTEFINRPKNVKSLKHLTVHPSHSQLILAKSRDGIWYRAQVMELSENDEEYEVLYVDYGTVDIISLSNMREVEPTYLHLPFQAIPCELANVKLPEESSMSEKASDVFRREFVGHDLKAEVINRYSQFNCLSLKLFCKKKGDVGEWLCSEGLCELVQNVKHQSKYIV